MNVVTAGIRLAVLALPPTLRPRYRGEWSADLAGADELGIFPAAVLLGAFGTVLSVDRTDPMITGLPRSQLRQRRGRWAAAMLGAAGLVAAGSILQGYDVRSILGVIMIVIITVGVLAGCRMLIGVFRIPPPSLAAPVTSRPVSPVPAPTRWAYGAGFALATLVTVAVGVLHITVWNPLAKIPGSSLGEIYAAMAAVDEGAGPSVVIAWVILAVGAAISYLLFCVLAGPRRPLTRRQMLMLGLLLLGGAILAGWFAAFPMGMGLADTFGTDGGDAAPTGPALALAGHLALAAGLLLGLAPPAMPRRRVA